MSNQYMLPLYVPCKIMHGDSKNSSRYMYITYRIAGNFRGQATLHKNFPHENVGVAYRNACNEVKQNLYSRKSPFSI